MFFFLNFVGWKIFETSRFRANFHSFFFLNKAVVVAIIVRMIALCLEAVIALLKNSMHGVLTGHDRRPFKSIVVAHGVDMVVVDVVGACPCALLWL